ncbi:MAG: YicC/YloC family endoribonuclease, partial [Limisphaerales bacterium]
MRQSPAPPDPGFSLASSWQTLQRRPMRSMTGFGRGVHVADGARVGVEIRSVNRKQAEV